MLDSIGLFEWIGQGRRAIGQKGGPWKIYMFLQHGTREERTKRNLYVKSHQPEFVCNSLGLLMVVFKLDKAVERTSSPKGEKLCNVKRKKQ